jgi:hypothetical protein
MAKIGRVVPVPGIYDGSKEDDKMGRLPVSIKKVQ